MIPGWFAIYNHLLLRRFLFCLFEVGTAGKGIDRVSSIELIGAVVARAIWKDSLHFECSNFILYSHPGQPFPLRFSEVAWNTGMREGANGVLVGQFLRIMQIGSNLLGHVLTGKAVAPDPNQGANKGSPTARSLSHGSKSGQATLMFEKTRYLGDGGDSTAIQKKHVNYFSVLIELKRVQPM